MWRRSNREPSVYDDDWEDQPTQSGFHQWFVGGVIALAIVGYGISAIWTRSGWMPGRGGGMSVLGLNALAYGIGCTAAGVFVHCHYFWGNVYNEAWPAVLGKILSAIAFVGAIGMFIIRWGVLGRNS